jgi:hypothetical protein
MADYYAIINYDTKTLVAASMLGAFDIVAPYNGFHQLPALRLSVK